MWLYNVLQFQYVAANHELCGSRWTNAKLQNLYLRLQCHANNNVYRLLCIKRFQSKPLKRKNIVIKNEEPTFRSLRAYGSYHHADIVGSTHGPHRRHMPISFRSFLFFYFFLQFSARSSVILFFQIKRTAWLTPYVMPSKHSNHIKIVQMTICSSHLRHTATRKADF